MQHFTVCSFTALSEYSAWLKWNSENNSMLVEIRAPRRPTLYCDKDFAEGIGVGLSELLSKTEQQRMRRNLLKEYGALLHERRKIRGVTMLELSRKTRVRRDDIELAERGLLRLSDEEKERIKKFLRRQPII